LVPLSLSSAATRGSRYCDGIAIFFFSSEPSLESWPRSSRLHTSGPRPGSKQQAHGLSGPYLDAAHCTDGGKYQVHVSGSQLYSPAHRFPHLHHIFSIIVSGSLPVSHPQVSSCPNSNSATLGTCRESSLQQIVLHCRDSRLMLRRVKLRRFYDGTAINSPPLSLLKWDAVRFGSTIGVVGCFELHSSCTA